jgi:KUP system potassium uptake protein
MQSAPWVRDGERLQVELTAQNFWRGVARFGFMERPDMPALLLQANACGCGLDLHDVTYYVGHETVIPREDHKGVPRLVERLYSFMQRNSAHVSDYFRLPADHVVEIGREIAI